ncbi:MAG: hypothetical protein IT463_05495 [Planctomycetes bacterium]|nr:hypothetical protein [Planctomycetota bacterium]
MSNSRSRNHLTALLLVLLLGLAAGAVWVFWLNDRPDKPGTSPSGQAAQRNAAPDTPALPASEGGSSEVRAGAPNNTPANATTEAAPKPEPEPPTETKPGKLWLVGRVVGAKLGDVDLWRSRRTDVYLDCMDMPAQPQGFDWSSLPDDYAWNSYEVTPDEEGWFRVEVSAADFLQAPGPHLLWGASASDWGRSALSRAREEDAGVDLSGVPGLLRPAYRGSEIDFGEIELGEGTLDNTWIIRGRILGPGARPLRTTQWFALRADTESATDEQAEPAYAEHIWADANGEFTVMHDQWLEEYLAGVLLTKDATALTRLVWRVVAGEWDDEVGDADIPVSAPAKAVLRGRVLDLGDLELPGALLELSVCVHGEPASPLPRDPCSHSWNSGELLSFALDTAATSHSVWVPAGYELLMLMPEGRYRWNCQFPDSWDYKEGGTGERIGLPAQGEVILNEGGVTRLEVELQVVQAIPVRCIDEQDRPVRDFTVQWTLDLPGSEGLRTSATGCVPVLAGRVTTVVASVLWEGKDKGGRGTMHLQEAYSEAKAGDREVVIRFEGLPPELVIERGSIRVVLPVLPAEFGLKNLAANLVARDQNGTRTAVEVDLWRERSEVAEITDLLPGQYAVELRGGGIWGHPGGLLCVVAAVEVVAGQTVQVDLPAVAVPPEKTPVGSVRALVRVGGKPTDVTTHWIGDDGSRQRINTSDNGDTLWEVRFPERGRAVRRESNDVGFRPVEICDGDRRIPVQVERPQQDWGEMNVTADLPSRLRLQVVFGGEKVQGFTAKLYQSDISSNATSMEGEELLLWAPIGTATLNIHVTGCSGWHTEGIAVKDTEQTYTLDLAEEGYARLDVACEEGDDVLWRIGRPETGQDWESVGTGAVFVRAGTYRLAPEAEYPQEVAFSLDLAVGESRRVNLPRLKQPEPGTVRLSVRPEDWAGYESAVFEAAVIGATTVGASVEFATGFARVEYKELPDAIELRGLQHGTRVVLRGIMTRLVDGASRQFRMETTTMEVKKGASAAPRWQRAIELGSFWPDVNCYSTSESGDGWVKFDKLGFVLPGRHDLVFFSPGNETELFRATIEVASDAEVVPLPDGAFSKLHEAGYWEGGDTKPSPGRRRDPDGP